MGRRNEILWISAIWVLIFSWSIPSEVFAQPIKMIMTHEIALTHWKHPLMAKYGKMVEERTKGRIKVELYPSGQLYSDKAAVAALGTGAVHMVWPVTVNLESMAQALAILSFPMFIEDEMVLTKSNFKKDLEEMFSKYLAPKKIRVMGIARSNEVWFIFRKGFTPQKVTDLKGLKMRVTGGLLWLDVFKFWGATAVGMPASEMAAGLAQGVIDGIQTSPAGWASMVGMAAPYAILPSDLWIGTYTVVVDDNWFSQLPQDIRGIIQGTLDEVLAAQWQYSIGQDDSEIKKMEKQGAKTYVIKKEEIKREWIPLCKPAVENFAKRFPDAYKEALTLKAKYGH